jgi:lysophospholipase L1-like esterase
MLTLFLAAAAAINTIGVTDNPCPNPVVMNAELQAWRTAVYAPNNHVMIPPPMDAAIAYRNAYLEARKTDWPDLCGFRAANLKLIARPQAERDVVFMGDSITAAWEFGDPSLFRTGWVDRGISGQTTQQMLLRFPADVLALHPRVVHIMAGTNDVAGNTGPTTYDDIVGNIAAMVVLAKAAGIRVVLAAVPPSAGFNWAAIKPVPVIAALNQRLKALAVREKVTFVDYGAVLAAPDGAMKADLTLDGTHPATAGYALMAPLARQAIATARKPR